jgi:glutamate carboxypeptidase
MNIRSLTEACAGLWPEAKKFLQEMVTLNSFTTHPLQVNRVGELVASRFGRLGFTPSFVPHASDVYGSHLVLKHAPQAGRPTVALLAHLDTVFPPDEEVKNAFHWREEGSRIYGPGTNDIKGGIALIFLMLAVLQEQWPDLFNSVNWVVLCNACEEIDSEDFGVVCRQQLPPDTLACLIFEADGEKGDRGRLVTERKGRATFRIDVRGRGAHAGSQHARGANAIVQLGRVIGDLDALTNYDAGLTVNVGTICGGTVINRVPETASAELEVRASSVRVFEDAKNSIRALEGVGDLRSRDEDAHPCQIQVSQIDETVPWPKNDASERLFSFWEAAGRETGCEVTAGSRGGLSDGNVLWSYFPTLDGLGPQGDHAHCSENDPAIGKEQEYVEAGSFVPKAVLNIAAIARLVGVSG